MLRIKRLKRLRAFTGSTRFPATRNQPLKPKVSGAVVLRGQQVAPFGRLADIRRIPKHAVIDAVGMLIQRDKMFACAKKSAALRCGLYSGESRRDPDEAIHGNASKTLFQTGSQLRIAQKAIGRTLVE